MSQFFSSICYARKKVKVPSGTPVQDSLDGPTSPSPPAPPRKTESAEDALEALEASAEATEKGDADRVVGGEEEEEKEEGGEFQESWTPLEMHAIAERLRSSTPLPRCAAAPADDPQGQK